jgi:hypothetical protein
MGAVRPNAEECNGFAILDLRLTIENINGDCGKMPFNRKASIVNMNWVYLEKEQYFG